MDFDFSERSAALQRRLQAFMDEHVYPAEHAYEQPARGGREPLRDAAAGGGTQGQGARGGAVEPVPARSITAG